MIRGFLSYKYDDDGKKLADLVRKLLETLRVDVIDGTDLTAGQPTDTQICERIRNCHFLICLRSRVAEADYLDSEAGFARGNGVPVIHICDSSATRRGIFNEDYVIALEKGEFNAAIELTNSINRIKHKENVSEEPPVTHHSPVATIEAEGWPDAIKKRIYEIRAAFDTKSFQDVLDKATALYNETNCWRAAVARSAALVNLGRYDEADDWLGKVIPTFAGNNRALALAYHNKGGCLVYRPFENQRSRREAVEQAASYYQRSVNLEPGFFVYIDLVLAYLEMSALQESEAAFGKLLNHWPDARDRLRKEIEARGAQFVQLVCKSQLIADILYPQLQRGVKNHEA